MTPTSCASPSLSVVCPVYGNAESLVALHGRIQAALAGGTARTIQIVFVNDASPDDSATILADLAARDDDVETITHPVNLGQHWAIRTGLEAARGDRVVVLDADLQDPPEAIPAMLAEMDRSDADVVFAARSGRYAGRGRHITGRVFKRTLALLLDVPADAGGFVLLRRGVVRDVLDMVVHEPYLLGLLGATDATMATVPVDREPRPHGQSGFTSTARVRLAARALAAAARVRVDRVRRRPARDRHNDVQRRYYDVVAEENARIRPADTPYVHRHLDRLIDFGDIHTEDALLDVGCGMGKFTLPLLARGYDVEGLDLSPELLREFRRHSPPGREPVLHEADILALPEHLHGRFDAVIGFFVLHHLIDVEASFRALRACLKPGGRMVFLEPNGWCPLYYAQVTLTPGMSWRADHRIRQMRQVRLTQALIGAGLHDVRAERSGILPPALANRPIGPRLESAFERIRPAEPFRAFQLVAGTEPSD